MPIRHSPCNLEMPHPSACFASTDERTPPTTWPTMSWSRNLGRISIQKHPSIHQVDASRRRLTVFFSVLLAHVLCTMKTHKKNMGTAIQGKFQQKPIRSELQSCVIMTWLSKVEGQKMKDQVNAFMQVSIMAINFCNSRKYPGLRKIGTTFMNGFSSNNNNLTKTNQIPVSMIFPQAVYCWGF